MRNALLTEPLSLSGNNSVNTSSVINKKFLSPTEIRHSAPVPERRFQKMKLFRLFRANQNSAQLAYTTWLWKQSTTSSHHTACK